MQKAAIGIADHNGWANLVTVTLTDGVVAVIDRRRVELIESHLPTQPYHHEALEMDPAEADTLVTLVRASVAGAAAEAFERLATDLAGTCELARIAIRTPPIDSLPRSVAEVHASRRIMMAADGMIYHEALCRAARARGLSVEFVARRTELERATDVLGGSPADVEASLERLGSALGPPWLKEHTFTAAAAVAALKR